jgi:hypothetical protein
MPEILSVATWKRTYSENFPLVDISELQPLPLSMCYLPLTRVTHGRPKKERFRKEDLRGPRGAAVAVQLAEPLATTTTRSGCLTIILPAAAEDIFQALVVDLINKLGMCWDKQVMH